MFGVATWTPFTINGAVTARIMKRIDIRNIAVPAMLPMRFKVVSPREDSQRKSKNNARQIKETVMDETVLIKSPLPLNSQLKAIKIACGFWAK